MKSAQLQQAVGEILREEVARRGKVNFRVTGNSMAPLLKPGDIVTVRRVRRRWRLLPGDILVLSGDGPLVVHHFLYWTLKDGQPHLRTAGRNGKALDRLWPREAVIGRVTLRERGKLSFRGPTAPLWLAGSLFAALGGVLTARLERLLK